MQSASLFQRVNLLSVCLLALTVLFIPEHFAQAAVPTAQVSGNTNLCVGGSGIIQAALTGIAPWNLVWSDGFTQPGIAASPAVRTVSPSVTTIYRVQSVSDAGNASGLCSGEAVVRVLQSPVITSQPADAILCPGSTATFSVVASGIPSGTNGSSAVLASTSDQKTSCAVCMAPQIFVPGSGMIPYGISRSNVVIVNVSGEKTSLVYQVQTAAPLGKGSDTILVKPKKQVAHASLAAHHQKIGATVKRTYSRFGNLQVVKLPPGLTVANAIKQYQDSGLVEYAEPDYQVHAVLSPPK